MIAKVQYMDDLSSLPNDKALKPSLYGCCHPEDFYNNYSGNNQHLLTLSTLLQLTAINFDTNGTTQTTISPENKQVYKIHLFSKSLASLLKKEKPSLQAINASIPVNLFINQKARKA